LQPGEITSLPIDYSAVYCPGSIVDVTDAACVHEPLHVTIQDGWARVRGVFGCFEYGTVELFWETSDVDITGWMQIMTASPLQLLNVDVVTPVPRTLSRLGLRLLAEDGTSRPIAQVTVMKAHQRT
jgi:hypothetical protein